MIHELHQAISRAIVNRGLKRSPHWPEARDGHLKEFPFCFGCGTNEKVEVHHILPFHLFPEFELDPRNWLSLCMKRGHECHFRLGHLFDWSAWNPDVVLEAKKFHSQVRNRALSRFGVSNPEAFLAKLHAAA